MALITSQRATHSNARVDGGFCFLHLFCFSMHVFYRGADKEKSARSQEQRAAIHDLDCTFSASRLFLGRRRPCHSATNSVAHRSTSSGLLLGCRLPTSCTETNAHCAKPHPGSRGATGDATICATASRGACPCASASFSWWQRQEAPRVAYAYQALSKWPRA